MDYANSIDMFGSIRAPGLSSYSGITPKQVQSFNIIIVLIPAQVLWNKANDDCRK